MAALQRDCAVSVIALQWEWFLEEEAEEGRELPAVVVSPLSGWGVALGDRKREACDETWALSGVCCRRFTRASQVSPQQKGALDTISSSTTARCTMWTTQVITQPSVFTSFEGFRYFPTFFTPSFQSVCFSLSLNLCLILCYLRSFVPPSHTFTLSLYLSFTLNSLRSVDLSFCVKRELKTSRHSSVVGSGASSWIKVFTLVLTCAALWIMFLHGTVRVIWVKHVL